MVTSETISRRLPIRDGLLTDDLRELAGVRLIGSQCESCRETALGRRQLCPQCGGDRVKTMELSRTGVLWSYTVVRHRPPGNYKGPEPFTPFGVGLVELPDGVRVMTPLTCNPDNLQIGMPLVFDPYVRVDEDGREVVAFTFRSAD